MDSDVRQLSSGIGEDSAGVAGKVGSESVPGRGGPHNITWSRRGNAVLAGEQSSQASIVSAARLTHPVMRQSSAKASHIARQVGSAASER